MPRTLVPTIITLIILILLVITVIIGFAVIESQIAALQGASSSSTVSFTNCDESNPVTIPVVFNKCYDYNGFIEDIYLPTSHNAINGRKIATEGLLLIGNIQANTITLNAPPADSNTLCSFCPLDIPFSNEGEGVWIRVTVVPAFVEPDGFGGSSKAVVYELLSTT